MQAQPFRLNRWRSIPDAIDFYSASLDRTLKLVAFLMYLTLTPPY